MLLAAIPIMSLWEILPASAIGCAPLSLYTEGPYQSSLQGVVSIDNETVGRSVKGVYVVEPGSSVNMTFGVVFYELDYQNDRLVIPHLIFYPESLLDANWLSVSYSPNPVVMKLFQEKANVSVTLNIAEDAPRGDYGVMLSARIPGGGDCGYGGGAFILRVGLEKPVHPFTLSYLSSSSDSRASVRPVSEKGQLAALLVTLEKNSSAELNIHLSSEYPDSLYFNMQLANVSARSRNTSMTTQGLGVTMIITGITYEQGRCPLNQHNSGNISIMFSTKGDVKEGAYLVPLILDAYLVPAWFNNPKIEASEVLILILVGEKTTTTSTVTKTMSTTSTITSTSLSTTTSTETITDPSTYAWAIGATVIAAVFAVVLLRRKS